MVENGSVSGLRDDSVCNMSLPVGNSLVCKASVVDGISPVVGTETVMEISWVAVVEVGNED